MYNKGICHTKWYRSHHIGKRDKRKKMPPLKNFAIAKKKDLSRWKSDRYHSHCESCLSVSGVR